MKRKVFNGSLMKIAMIAVFLVFLVGTASADLTIGEVKADYSYDNFTSAMETNTINVTNIHNSDDEAVYNVGVYLYATNNSGTVEVASTSVPVIGGIGDSGPVYIVDPTIRNYEEEMHYTVNVTVGGVVYDSQDSETIYVRFNGYKGKWPYWPGKSNITTQYAITCNRTMIYYNQTDAMYVSSSWTERTETWTSANLPVPDYAIVEKVLLYLPYSWDSTAGGVPAISGEFNDHPIDLGTPYTDEYNIGRYGDRKYGLYSVDVTCLFDAGETNILYLERDTGVTGSQSLYPSTLVVVYLDLNETRTNVYINEEADYLLVADKYGVVGDEAIAYAPFLGVCNASVSSAKLYSFAASAGPNEGNLFFNDLDTPIATNLWQGNSKSAYPEIKDVTADLLKDNLVAIQGTSSGGMLAIQQILVVEYNGC